LAARARYLAKFDRTVTVHADRMLDSYFWHHGLLSRMRTMMRQPPSSFARIGPRHHAGNRHQRHRSSAMLVAALALRFAADGITISARRLDKGNFDWGAARSRRSPNRLRAARFPATHVVFKIRCAVSTVEGRGLRTAAGRARHDVFLLHGDVDGNGNDKPYRVPLFWRCAEDFRHGASQPQ